VNWLNRDRRVDLAIFIVALALRLAWVGYVEHRGGDLFGPDAPSYDTLAMNLLAGKGLQKEDYTGLFSDPNQSITVQSFRPPLLPVVLAGIYGVAGHHFWVARLVMALLSAATCVVVCRLARRLLDSTTGGVAGLLMAIYPKFVYYSAALITETLYTFLLAAAVAGLLAAHRAERGWWRWVVSGIVLGLCTLSRTALLAFPPVVAVWLVATRPRRARAIGEAALLGLGFVAAMAPWWMRNAAVHGRFVAGTTEGGVTFWVTNNEEAEGGGHVDFRSAAGGFEGLNELEIDREFYRRGLAYIRAHPGHLIRLAGEKFVRFWRLWPHASEPSVGLAVAIVGAVSFTPVLLLGMWGAVVSRRHWRPLLLFYLLLFYCTALHMVFMAVTRHRVPIVPYLIVLAAYGLVELLRRWGRQRRAAGGVSEEL